MTQEAIVSILPGYVLLEALVSVLLLVVAESCKDRAPALRAQPVAPEAASNRRAVGLNAVFS